MSVYRPKGSSVYHYDFWYKGQRHRESTGQRDKGDAERVEWRLKERLAQEAQGIAPFDAETAPASPRIQDWANVYLAHKMADNTDQRALKRPDLIERTLRIVLRFFGSCPADPARQPRPGEDAPFRDLTLADPITHPEIVQEFEEWMNARRKLLPRRNSDPADAPPRYGGPISGSAKNTYRAAMSGMYKVALLPKYRALSGVTSNPWEHVARARRKRRRLQLSLEQLRAWFMEAAPHVKIALAIGALAPALRLENILELEWTRDLDPEWTTITVTHHKRDERGEPLVVPIREQLRRILTIAWRHRRPSAAAATRGRMFVVHYRGEPIADIKKALAGAARRAGVPYGLQAGSTFHTLRHFASTVLAKSKVSEQERKAASGHSDIRTVQIYTHLAGTDAEHALEVLSSATPLVDLITDDPTGYRRSWGTMGKTTGTGTRALSETPRKTGTVLAMRKRTK